MYVCVFEFASFESICQIAKFGTFVYDRKFKTAEKYKANIPYKSSAITWTKPDLLEIGICAFIAKEAIESGDQGLFKNGNDNLIIRKLFNGITTEMRRIPSMRRL